MSINMKIFNVLVLTWSLTVAQTAVASSTNGLGGQQGEIDYKEHWRNGHNIQDAAYGDIGITALNQTSILAASNCTHVTPSSFVDAAGSGIDIVNRVSSIKGFRSDLSEETEAFKAAREGNGSQLYSYVAQLRSYNDLVDRIDDKMLHMKTLSNAKKLSQGLSLVEGNSRSIAKAAAMQGAQACLADPMALNNPSCMSCQSRAANVAQSVATGNLTDGIRGLGSIESLVPKKGSPGNIDVKPTDDEFGFRKVLKQSTKIVHSSPGYMLNKLSLQKNIKRDHLAGVSYALFVPSKIKAGKSLLAASDGKGSVFNFADGVTAAEKAAITERFGSGESYDSLMKASKINGGDAIAVGDKVYLYNPQTNTFGVMKPVAPIKARGGAVSGVNPTQGVPI